MKKRLIKLSLFSIFVLVAINPITLSYFDPTPPLSKLVIFLNFGFYIAVLIIGLFYVYFGIQTFLVLGITLSILFGCEILLRIPIEIDSTKEFRLKQPEPYQSADYFSVEFIEESIKSPGGFHKDEKTGIIYPFNHSGKYFNVIDNRRVTTNQPHEYRQTVYLFGGSTMYSAESPDQHTIASHLQRLVANNGVRVVNYGVSASYSKLNFSRLKKDVKLKKGDIVIFYGGVNDVLFRCVYQNIDGYIYGKPQNQPFIVDLLNNAGSRSKFVQKAIEISQKGKAPHYSEESIEAAVDDYYKKIEEVQKYVVSQNAKFFHFIQPNLITKATKNEYELNLMKTDQVPSYVVPAFQKMYPKIIEKFSEASFSHDISQSFSSLSSSPFFDYSHTNHIGNEKIANDFYATIFTY